MATLVFSTVGTMLGGPAGGAIGSMIGQSFDQQLLGGGLRKGPRIGDLAVQSSAYGTAIPRIYGTMRVAGSVIWATDLKESATQIGAKGQPESEVYSYSVSLAVALSSRLAGSIGRIWADGKLLRGAAGDFKVSTQFRFYDGSEEQPLDPLIASVEGIASTPAYRGLAMAVFEDLELAEYGNRIPFLTFELRADEGDVTIASVLADASARSIDCTAGEQIRGYAAHGPNIRAAIEPLVECFGIELFDDGRALKSASATGEIALGETELGCAAESDSAPRWERSVAPAETMPGSIGLTYYDPDRDYQAGQKRASAAGGGVELRLDAPIVLEARAARSRAETVLARSWSRRERMSICVGPNRMDIKPGVRVTIGDDPKRWVVERCTVEAMAVRLNLRGTGEIASSLPADGGRASSGADIVASPTQVALFDLPLPDAGADGAIQVATASASKGWKPVGLQVSVGGETLLSASSPLQSVLGKALDVLAPGQAWLFDETSHVEVQLVDADDWLTSCDDQALLNGANMAALGRELFQFGSADVLGPGRFRLSRLLRGRRGTEWAMDGHVAGEAFTLLTPSTFRTISLPASAKGSEVRVTPLGIADGGREATRTQFSGEAARPPGPVHLRAAIEGDGSLRADWIRRSPTGWDWLDEVDAPLGESVERYRLSVSRTGGAAEFECGSAGFSLDAAGLDAIGTGPVVISVCQVGDRAVSRPAILTIAI